MSNIVQVGDFQSEDYGLTAVYYTATLTHNTQATIPTGPVTNKYLYDVLIATDAARGLQTIVGLAWALDGSNQPLVTVQLASAAGTIVCRVCLLYKI